MLIKRQEEECLENLYSQYSQTGNHTKIKKKIAKWEISHSYRQTEYYAAMKRSELLQLTDGWNSQINVEQEKADTEKNILHNQEQTQLDSDSEIIPGVQEC